MSWSRVRQAFSDIPEDPVSAINRLAADWPGQVTHIYGDEPIYTERWTPGQLRSHLKSCIARNSQMEVPLSRHQQPRRNEGPLILVELLDGSIIQVDGRRRLNKWVREGYPGPFEVLIIRAVEHPVYVLTPTGGRPDSFSLLAQYINRQTYAGPLTWVVVDDCRPSTPVPDMREGVSVTYLRPPWVWKPGDNTQAACMLHGIDYVPPHALLLVMEDDDYYRPNHIDQTLGMLKRADLVGHECTPYYNVPHRLYRQNFNREHASLMACGFKGEAIDCLWGVCERAPKYIDMDVWGQYRGPKYLSKSPTTVGVKGLPGRHGIGSGHDKPNGWTQDAQLSKLREWIGGDVSLYYPGQ